MENIEQFGDLSESEIAEFLSEIEYEDDSMDESSDNSDKAIEYIESIESCLPEEKMEDGAWELVKDWQYDEKNSMYKLVGSTPKLSSDLEKIKAEDEQRAKDEIAKRKLRKLEIQRMAFSQSLIDLSSRIPNDNLKLLITCLTKAYAENIERSKTFINRRLGKLLRPFIPGLVKTCYARYPHTVTQSKGFMYYASKDFGEGRIFWATPDIPYYFEQGTEMDILRNTKSDFLFAVDRAVVRYDYNTAKLAEKEVAYAAKLVQLKAQTYIELLKFNPFWFEILFNELLKRSKDGRE